MAGTTSLRKQHTSRTRARIAEVAIELIIEQGYDATTVDEIAARADVSPRTFFRYFPTKEAVLFHDLDDRLDALIDQIEQRPSDESPATTLIAIVREMARGFSSEGTERRLFCRMLTERPSLRVYQRTTIAEHLEREIATALANHAGLPADDLSLQVAVAVVGSCLDILARNWVRNPESRTFLEALDEVFTSCATAFPDGSAILSAAR